MLMRIIKKRRRARVFSLVALILVAGGYVAWTMLKPLPGLQPNQAVSVMSLKTGPSQLAWPAGSQAAVGVLGTNILETSGAQTPVATASTAKVITALVVLDKKPLNINQAGPNLTMTADDVARYSNYLAQNGSVVPVQAGEKLSQYQALQAVLLPSSNNLADSLAIWAYGSLPAYTAAANQYLKQHGLNSTTVGSDASGLAPDSTSTANDLVKLGKLAMINPVIAEIAGQKTAGNFPLGTTTGTIKNVNYLLGTDGIIGIKTGNSDHVGGAFIGAANTSVNGQTKTIVSAVTNAPSLVIAMQQSKALLKSAQTNFKPVQVTKKDTVIGKYYLPWGGTVSAVASHDLSVQAWQGSSLQTTSKLSKIESKASAGQAVGKLNAENASVTIKLKTAPTQPSIWWRLAHPLN